MLCYLAVQPETGYKGRRLTQHSMRTMTRILSIYILSLYLALFISAGPSPEQSLLAPSDPQVSSSWAWSDCGECSPPNVCSCMVSMTFSPGTATDIVQVNSLEVSPDPPKPGQNLTVTASGYVSKTIQVSYPCFSRSIILNMYRQVHGRTSRSSWG